MYYCDMNIMHLRAVRISPISVYDICCKIKECLFALRENTPNIVCKFYCSLYNIKELLLGHNIM